jgi:Bacterial alpha-L-rhamnosidase 6 hairpin glycosidase domain/Bacterial alpha-L-rhamnosidase C-terminal domain
MKKLIAAFAALLALPVTAQAKDWQDYVLAPASREVAPARILGSQGVADPGALLAPGGGAARLTETIEGATRWPAGTTAAASSFHAPNTNNGQPRTYAPANTLDGDQATFWNDDTIGAYPDTLTITAPSARTLPGITLISNADGVPVDFTVATWDGSQFVTQATVTGNGDVTRAVRFTRPVTTTQVRITITRDQATTPGEFSRVAEVQPGIVTQPYVDVDFGQELAGRLDLRFGDVSDPAPLVRVATSETKQYLSDRSDFSRSDFANGTGTDDHTPAAGELWHDGDLRGFRYARIYLGSPGSVEVDSLALSFTPYLGTPDTYKGHFLSSDDLLNRIWYASTYTVELDTDTFTEDSVEPRNAWSPSLDGKRVIHDGAKRDRDPYVGDLAVSDLTNFVSHVDPEPITNVLGDLAEHQRADGWIPPTSINDYTLPLFDYPAWWVVSVHDYALYTGDTAFARKYWPQLVKTLNSWYPSVTDANGLLNKGMNGTGGYGDYAFLPRSGEVAYYNVLYVQALKDAAALAEALGDGVDAGIWRGRAAAVGQAVQDRLWDPKAGAYLDSTTGTPMHPEDANSIAVLAGVGDSARHAAALDYLAGALARPWGNAFADNDTYFGGASDRVYAFLNYPEVAARFKTGKDASALELLRRSWGWMIDHDPGNTTWEATGAGGDIANYEGAYSSQAHGWASGAAPALTNSVLGVTPTSMGFATYDVVPHPGDVEWAKGDVPTPHGTVSASWEHHDARFTLQLTSPAGTTARIGVPTFGRRIEVRLDGAPVSGIADGGYVYLEHVAPGEHTISASSPSDDATVGGSVPATLALSLGGPASFGTFTPFADRDYSASTTATVTSTAADAALSVADPSATATGHLVNGDSALPRPLQAGAGGAFAPVGGWSSPTRLASWDGPVSNAALTLSFKQAIGAGDALRTGRYAKTLTFVLTTTAP